jgi:hypothetical protein
MSVIIRPFSTPALEGSVVSPAHDGDGMPGPYIQSVTVLGTNAADPGDIRYYPATLSNPANLVYLDYNDSPPDFKQLQQNSSIGEIWALWTATYFPYASGGAYMSDRLTGPLHGTVIQYGTVTQGFNVPSVGVQGDPWADAALWPEPISATEFTLNRSEVLIVHCDPPPSGGEQPCAWGAIRLNKVPSDFSWYPL